MPGMPNDPDMPAMARKLMRYRDWWEEHGDGEEAMTDAERDALNNAIDALDYAEKVLRGIFDITESDRCEGCGVPNY